MACGAAGDIVGRRGSRGGEAKLAVTRRVSRTRMRASVEEATDLAAELGDWLSLMGAIERRNLGMKNEKK